MAKKQSKFSWMKVIDSIGYHLLDGKTPIAHAWEANGNFFISFMGENEKGIPAPPYGPYFSMDSAKEAAEAGVLRLQKIATIKKATIKKAKEAASKEKAS